MSMDELGTAFMLKRKQLGISQGVLSERTGLSRAIISLIELGAGNPTIVTLSKIAAALGFEIDVALRAQVDAPKESAS